MLYVQALLVTDVSVVEHRRRSNEHIPEMAHDGSIRRDYDIGEMVGQGNVVAVGLEGCPAIYDKPKSVIRTVIFVVVFITD